MVGMQAQAAAVSGPTAGVPTDDGHDALIVVQVMEALVTATLRQRPPTALAATSMRR